MPYFVYLLQCRGKSYYCGFTRNLEKRLEAHNSGRGGRYTRSHRPVKLVYFEKKRTLRQAMARELGIKAMGRARKQGLIDGKGSAQKG